METVKNLFFQDHHTNQKKKLLKISYFKTTTPSQNFFRTFSKYGNC